MEFCLVPTLGKWAEGQPRSVVVLDNSTNHTGLRTRMLIEDAGARLIFTAPNAADLNPLSIVSMFTKQILSEQLLADVKFVTLSQAQKRCTCMLSKMLQLNSTSGISTLEWRYSQYSI